MLDNKPINREDPFGSVGQFTLQKIPAGTAWAIASNEDRVEAPDRFGCNHHGDGADGEGHEQQVQGNQ